MFAGKNKVFHSNQSLKLFALLVVLFLSSTALFAELPPYVYAEQQNEAQEVLQIEVQQVSLDWCFWCAKRDVKIKARVLQIKRSKIGLKPGQLITIRYTHTPLTSGETGPSPIPILKEAWQGPAFLDRVDVNYKDGIVFKPIAGGYSFRELD